MKKLFCLVSLLICLSAITVRADTLGDYTFNIPEGLTKTSENEETLNYWDETKTVNLSITISDSSITTKEAWDEVVEKSLKSLSDSSYSSRLLLSLKDGDVCGNPALFKTLVGVDSDGKEQVANICVFNDMENKKVYLVFLTNYLSENGKPNLLDEFNEMVEGITPVGQEKSSSDTEISSDGVTPEFKEKMDSLVAFFKEYNEFMKEYAKSDSSDVMGTLTKYTEMLTKYSDAMTALDSIDQESLSDADEKYYLQTLVEVEKLTIDVLN